MKRLILMALLLSIGCGASNECIDRTEQLKAALAKIPGGGRNLAAQGIDWPFDLLVELDGGIEAADDIDPASLVLFAFPTGFRIENGDLNPARTVTEAMVGLKEEFEKDEMLGRKSRVLLLPRHDTSWSVMAIFFEALRELGRTDVDVLFWRDAELPPAPNSSITAELQALPRDDGSVAAMRLVEKTFAPCETLEPLFVSVDWSDREAGEAKLVAGIPEALRACGCKADPAAVEALFHFWFAPKFIPAVVRLHLAPKAPETAERLVLGRDLTWLEAHGQVVAARDRPMAYAWE